MQVLQSAAARGDMTAARSVMRFAVKSGGIAVDSVDIGIHVRYSPTTTEITRHGAILAALVLLVCTACPLRAGEVYKSVDAEGHIVYSDRPDTAGAQKSVVHSDPSNPTEVARLAKEQEIQKAEELQRNRQKGVEETKKAQQDQVKQAQCDSARNRYYSLKDARRIFDLDAAGNPHYYSDAEGDAKREEARQAMTAACET
jgi:alcohol dehydrogenase class IV